MTMDMKRVLLVEADATSSREYGKWLEDYGYDVMACPGPTAPDYTCLGAREGYCPLVRVADVVVLDLDLDSEIEETGTSASELLGLYTNSGKPVVAVGSDPRIVRVFPQRLTTGLAGPVTRGELVEAVTEEILRAGG